LPANSDCRTHGTYSNNSLQSNKIRSQDAIIPIKGDSAVDDNNIAVIVGDSKDVHGEGGHHHATRSIILILALSLHRIFEGMSVGLQDSVINVASLFAAVMCHEMVIGLSLGLQFVKSEFSLRRLLIVSFVCSSIMPVGVLMGLAMTETGSDASSIDIANGLLQATAMGTFIYVTFFEILQEEVDAHDTSLAKVVCVAAGFAMMALLNLIPEEQLMTRSSPAGFTTQTPDSLQNTTAT
jgi:solute carrier family 39 (zinc transporter), member 1/2/3